MANTIILKQSSVASKVPLPGDLSLGELAINTTDGKLFTKKGDGSVIELTQQPDISTKLDKVNGVSTGLYETIVAMTGTVIDVSAGNVQTVTISANTTFTFTGWTTNASSVVLELTAGGTETVTFTGATFKTAPILAAGLNVFVFTSTDGGTTINGYIARDGA